MKILKSGSEKHHWLVLVFASILLSSAGILANNALAQVNLLPPPTGLSASTVSTSQINLSWYAPSNTGSAGVNGYKIERSADKGSTWSAIVSNTGNTGTAYSDNGLAASTTYTYRVSAIYLAGTSPPSNTASATTQSTTYQLTVTTKLTTGGSHTGTYTELRNSTGQIVATGFTPTAFILSNGVQYTVGVGNYATYFFDHWLDTNSTINPRPVSITSNQTITAVFVNKALTLSPSWGLVGTTVTATGTTFSPSHAITLTYDGTALITSPSTITSNSTGGFSATFQVPTSTAGTHQVQATDGTNTYSALFTVASGSSTISLNTNTTNIGDGIRITGTNFSPSSQITLTYDGYPFVQNSTNDDSTPSTVKTDSSGNFVAIIATEHSVTGIHTISAKDLAKNTASQSITVTPHVFIYPTSGHNGTKILIPDGQGNGFAASSPITIKFGSTTITPSSAITTDTTGNFGASFIVPSTASPNTYPVSISDGKGNTYSTSFTVTPSTTPMYSTQSVVTGLNMPDSFAFIPDNGPGADGSGAFMVVEKNTGNVIVFKNTNGQFVRQPVPFVTVPNLQTGAEDNGLLGIAFDPKWTSSKLVYFYATRTVSGSVVGEVIRYHATNDSSGNIVADQSVGELIILGNIPNWRDGHNGGCLKFDSAGNLYITASDGWTFVAGQDLTTLQGKMLRITPLASPVNGQLYSIPSTNPFASSTNTSIKKEIWAYGVRNPFTFDIDSETGRIYVSDVGYNAWERIDDFSIAGSNAGWPNYESPPFGNPQNLANYTPQVYWYPHEGVESQTAPEGLQAITGGAFYHGSYYPNLQGAYFFGDYGVHFIAALLPSSVATPQTDPASGVPKGQVIPIYYGQSISPISMASWNQKLYFLDLNGNVSVLNYDTDQPSSAGSATPVAPTGLKATAISPSQINLDWNAPTGTSLIVTGYKIERIAGSNTNWATIVSNTGNTSTKYSDTGLVPSTIYTYRVSAIYVAVESQPSNSASATTQCYICKLTVTTKLTTGGSLVGMYSTLNNGTTGNITASGFTPVTFTLTSGKLYTVGMGNYSAFVFDYWLDTNSTINPRPVSIINNTQITAVYLDKAPLILNPSKGPAGITVTATGTAFANSTKITLTYDGAIVATNPGIITSNSTGGFSATFQVPLGSVGPHEVQATDRIITHSAVFTDTAGP